jgi:uncharacterized protein YgiM (DUF1202 family)
MKRLSTVCVALFFGLSIGECGQMIASATLGDRYLKQISKSRHISAGSQKEAVNTAVKAAEKTGWTPKTVSVETGTVLAEYVADLKYVIVTRDYTFRLEARLPKSGKGDATIVIAPPPGLVSSRTMDKIADEYLDALTHELAANVNVAASETAEKKPPPEIIQQSPPQTLAEKAEVKPSAENPTQPSSLPPTSNPAVKETASQAILIATTAANVRSGPDVKSKIIAKLKKGEKVVKLDASDTRIRVKSSSGVTGWVSSKFVKK